MDVATWGDNGASPERATAHPPIASMPTYAPAPGAPRPAVKEEQIEYGFIGTLQNLKYEYRPDIRDRAALERNFREKFEALNRVHLSDGEFARLLDDIVTPDVFTAATQELETLRTHKKGLMQQLFPSAEALEA